MKKLMAFAAACLVVSVTIAAEKEECLEVGSDVAAFYVNDVTGPAAGEKLCYRCRYGARPVVSIFAREANDEVAALVKEIDAVVGKHQDDKMAGFVVLLTDDPEAQEPTLKQLAEKQGIKNVPLTTFDGQAGPPAYKISKDADYTVMMWVDSQLKVNQTFKKGELKEKMAAVVGDTAKILN